MKTYIERLNDQGKGISYINNKITFIENTLPKEEVEIEITKSNKKYNEAKLLNIINPSPNRVPSYCKLSNICGGCALSNMSYEDTLLFKKNKLQNILKKFSNINKDINIVPSNNILNYRNKVTLHIENKKIGYYKESTHSIVELNTCYLAKQSINEFINILPKYNISNGEVIIRSNYNDELLINFITDNEIKLINTNLKIVGILKNNKPIYNESYYIEQVNNLLFKVSYDSFFQINIDICSKIFNTIKNNILKDKVVLDLYCGVGTLGQNISNISKKIYGIEIVENAILNAIKNSKINNLSNTYYMCGDVSKLIDKINDKIEVVITDPPRSGLDNHTKEIINKMNPEQIIYISCDPITLSRDLNSFINYNITYLEGYDMFPYTYHVETICMLERK